MNKMKKNSEKNFKQQMDYEKQKQKNIKNQSYEGQYDWM